MLRNNRNTLRFILSLILFSVMFFSHIAMADQIFCSDPVADDKIQVLFERLALKQMALEFGHEGLQLSGTQAQAVGPDLVRVESFLKFRKPGRIDDSLMRVKGWISRCQGTLIIRGNTWLIDGSLSVERYQSGELAGGGYAFGDIAAPIHLIAFVDSRCPQCHRLIGYMRELVKDGKMYIEVRQTAFLEDAAASVQDTQLHLTEYFHSGEGVVSKGEYLELLGGFASEDAVDANSAEFKRALEMVEKNTRTARNVLHMTSVPGVLVMDDKNNKAYRMTSFWEMNRLFQPDL